MRSTQAPNRPAAADPRKALPFSLSQVRLLEGPFRAAMERCLRYLKDLEPDRLLAKFREHAGLQPKGEAYGGWESLGVAGHTLGHYLSACSMMSAAEGDPETKRRVEHIVSELAEVQSAHGDGYVGGISKEVFDTIFSGNWKAAPFGLAGGWVPWYNIHKTLAGLLHAYLCVGSDEALSVAISLADWMKRGTDRLSDQKFQEMLDCEYGGMNEALADLCEITGDGAYLTLARRFDHHSLFDPLSVNNDCLTGMHANTQIPKIIGAAREYEIQGDEAYRKVADSFWNQVVGKRTFVVGGNSRREHFQAAGEETALLGPDTAETCNTHNMLRLTRRLFSWRPDAVYMDYYERALYNHILGSQDPDSGMMTYFYSLKPGRFKIYSRPFDSFWCCVASGMENHSRYGESIYDRDAHGLWVNLYISSELLWEDKGFRLRQETDFPNRDFTQLTFTLEKPVQMSIRIRIPYWTTSRASVSINGKSMDTQVTPCSYLTIDREWRDGDTVQLRTPMSFHLHRTMDDPSMVALLYGPLVLAGELGREGYPEEDLCADQTAHEHLPCPDVPALVAGSDDPNDWVERIDEEHLRFRTRAVGRPKDVALIPIHEMHHQRYSVYWKLTTPEKWAEIAEDYWKKQQQQQVLDEESMDVFCPEMQSIRDHELTAEKSLHGETNNRKWIQCGAGGSITWSMKVDPNERTGLVCSYLWDPKESRFDILINGTKIAAQTTCAEAAVNLYFDVAYEIPPDLTKDKEHVEVSFVPHEGFETRPLAECRTMKRISP